MWGYLPMIYHSWKSLANHITSDPKCIIHGNKYIILFLAYYFMSWKPNATKNNLSIADFAIVTEDDIFWLSSTVDLWHHTNVWY